MTQYFFSDKKSNLFSLKFISCESLQGSYDLTLSLSLSSSPIKVQSVCLQLENVLLFKSNYAADDS